MKEWRLPGLETAHQRPNDRRCFQCVEREISQEKDKDSLNYDTRCARWFGHLSLP